MRPGSRRPEPGERRARRGSARLALAPAAAPGPVPQAPSSALWLALWLPELALEALGGSRAPRPQAVVEAAGVGARLRACNDAARAAGVDTGMRAGAASAVCPALVLRESDPDAEREALEAIAGVALGVSSMVSLEGSDGVVVEIGGSLRLFGGAVPLIEALISRLASIGYSACRGLAPTPSAAWLLARAGVEVPVFDRAALAARLAEVPIACLALPPRRHRALESMGIRTVGACLRLPRADLARRLGPELLAALDRALGRCPDPRLPYAAPDRFERSLSLPAEAPELALLTEAARRILGELEERLRARQQAVSRVEVHLVERSGPRVGESPAGYGAPPARAASRFTLELVTPTRDAAYLLSLLGERLQRLALDRPLERIAIHAPCFVDPGSPDGDLFGFAASDTEEAGPGEAGYALPPRASLMDWRALVDRLRARLGRAAVRGVATFSDHRPERAWRIVEPGTAGVHRFPPRPPWLLERPHPVGSSAGMPWIAGPVRLLAGPERIESGWWDGEDVARDYYRARDGRGRGLWVYRDRREPDRWFVHGVFG